MNHIYTILEGILTIGLMFFAFVGKFHNNFNPLLGMSIIFILIAATVVMDNFDKQQAHAKE